MKIRLLLTVFSVIAAALLAGCAAPIPLAGTPRGNEIVIGAVLPMTGKHRVYAERMLSGLRYAEQEINSRRGISRRRVRLTVFDSGGTAAGAAEAGISAAEKGAAGVIGGYSSSEAAALAEVAKKYRMPVIFPMATANDITGKDNPYALRCAYSDRQQGEALAAYLWYWRQLLRISVLIDTGRDTGYERSTARSTAKAFEELGGSVTSTPEYSGDQFEKAIGDALVSGPQAIVVSARGERAAAILKSIRKKGYTGIICGLDSWDDNLFFRALDDVPVIGECIFVSFFSPESGSMEFREFSEGFRRKYFHDPGSCETLSYDAFKLLAVALDNADSLQAFTANWFSVRNYFGASAVFSALPDGSIDRTMYINALDPAVPGLHGCRSRLIRSFMYSKLESYRN